MLNEIKAFDHLLVYLLSYLNIHLVWFVGNWTYLNMT